MVSLFPAATISLCIVALALGYAQVRADQIHFLDAGDLQLLNGGKIKSSKSTRSFLDKWALRLVPTLEKLLGDYVLGWFDQQLSAAGPGAVSRSQLLQSMVKLAIILVPIGILLVVQGRLIALPLVAVAIVILPVSRVSSVARKRRERIESDLPDFLDILAVTVSAGLSFRAALKRVTSYFQGPLAEEIIVALNELEHGVSLRGALQGASDRTRSELMKRFVRAFLQAEELGAPLAKTLNEIALDIRRESAQAAKKRASEAAPKVSLVTTVLFTPACIILIAVGIFLGAGIDFSELSVG